MQTMVAIGLIVLAILLFLAVKRKWISWINIQVAAAISGVLAFIATVLVFIISQQVSNPEIKMPHQSQVSEDTTQESGIASHDTNSDRPIISRKQVEPKVTDKRKFNLFVDVAPDRAGAKIYLNDVLYANAAPCTVKVQEGTHRLKLEYNDPYSPSSLLYIRSIVVSKDEVIRIESEEFKTK